MTPNHRPPVISIDVGRQLFVDDFLIEKTDLKRTWHQAEYYAGNPVLSFEALWERQGASHAMPFSDGVWFDPADRKFKMWYLAGTDKTCYAESRDGLRWIKPELDVVPGTNIVFELPTRDSNTIWMDLNEKAPSRRWKMVVFQRRRMLELHYSPDGIHWTKADSTPWPGDRTTFFYNPFRDVWVCSLRASYGGRRARAYREGHDLTSALAELKDHAVPWTGADELDRPHPKFPAAPVGLYNLDCSAYESLLLGLFSIYQGPSNRQCAELGIQKRNEVVIGFSRDGFHWQRPDRTPFLGVNETDGAWNWGNVQSAGGCCLIVGDELYFYVSGRAKNDQFWDGQSTTGLGILRRDGFASMDAGSAAGTLTTRRLRFHGRRLFVNAATVQGELRAEILDVDGNVIPPFTKSNSIPVSVHSTCAEMRFSGAEDLATLVNRTVRIRFHLRRGSLYSFWVSPDASGASHGYVAAGGPGFVTHRDTVGRAAYRAVDAP